MTDTTPACLKALEIKFYLLIALASIVIPWESAHSAATSFNPSIGSNFLILGRGGSRGLDPVSNDRNGIALQEAEVQLSADVDVYFKANALFSVSRPTPQQSYETDPEEVYVESLSLPLVTLKIGKFKAALGKHNELHTHAFPFIDQPLINTAVLGSEGLNEPAVSASLLLPTPWFSEVTVQEIGAENGTLYNSSRTGDLATVARLKNLWDLSTDLTLEWSLFGTGGRNQYDRGSRAWGSELTMKWRPSRGGKYQSLAWTTEYLNATIKGNPLGNNIGGIASWVQYQFAQRWSALARYEYVGLPIAEFSSSQTKQSALLGFAPTEFSGFRLQYDHIRDSLKVEGHQVALQMSVTIGAHPAHTY